MYYKSLKLIMLFIVIYIVKQSFCQHDKLSLKYFQVRWLSSSKHHRVGGAKQHDKPENQTTATVRRPKNRCLLLPLDDVCYRLATVLESTKLKFIKQKVS